MIRQGKKAFFVTCNLFSATCLALLLAPSPALADNECGLQLDPGNPETVTCDPADYASGYPDGITYSSNGDLSVVVPNGPGLLNVFDDGISVTGNGADSIFLDASAFTSTSFNNAEIRGTGGAMVDYLSDSGDIGIDVSGGRTSINVSMRAGAGNTHGIHAVSGSGNIDILVRGILANNNSANFTAIEAVTGGGDIGIVSPGGISSPSGNPNSLRNGIVAETSGDGAITIDVQSARAGDRGVGGGATALRAVTGTGDISFTGGIDVGFGEESIGIHATTEGAIDLNLTDVSGAGGIGILTENSEFVTINVTGSIEDWGTAIRSSGTAVLVNMLGTLEEGDDDLDRDALHGVLDFSGLTGSATLNFSDSRWVMADTESVFGDGDDTVTIGTNAYLQTPVNTSTSNTLDVDADRFLGADFGDGQNVLINEGTLLVGVLGGVRFEDGVPDLITVGNNFDAIESELRFEGLARFENAGTIYLGSFFTGSGVFLSEFADQWNDDMLSLPDTAFVGQEGSRIVLDAFFNALGQNGCSVDDRLLNGDFPANDCINLRGADSSATGRTALVVLDRLPGDRGAYNPDGNVVVDVSGSDPSANDPNAFFIGPDSNSYSPAFGGVIDKGVFVYTVGYDAETQQYKLYGIQGAAAQQYPLLIQSMADIWRSTASGWFERQVDMRDVDRAPDLGGGIWVRGSRVNVERDVVRSSPAGSNSLIFDNSFEQENTSITVGLDALSGNVDDGGWVAGVMVGYARSQYEFDHSVNKSNLEGMHFGLYGSATAGAWYADAALNGTWLTMDSDIPAFGLRPEDTLVTTDIASYGLQAETGMRWKMGRLGVEPLASLSYVQTAIDDISIPADDPLRFGAEFEFENAVSSRIGAGARFSMENLLPNVVPTHVSFTAKATQELDGEVSGSIRNLGPIDAPVEDTLDGTFVEVNGAVTITNTSKSVSGYLNVDGIFGDDYESLGLSAGFRYQW